MFQALAFFIQQYLNSLLRIIVFAMCYFDHPENVWFTDIV